MKWWEASRELTRPRGVSNSLKGTQLSLFRVSSQILKINSDHPRLERILLVPQKLFAIGDTLVVRNSGEMLRLRDVHHGRSSGRQWYPDRVARNEEKFRGGCTNPAGAAASPRVRASRGAADDADFPAARSMPGRRVRALRTHVHVSADVCRGIRVVFAVSRRVAGVCVWRGRDGSFRRASDDVDALVTGDRYPNSGESGACNRAVPLPYRETVYVGQSACVGKGLAVSVSVRRRKGAKDRSPGRPDALASLLEGLVRSIADERIRLGFWASRTVFPDFGKRRRIFRRESPFRKFLGGYVVGVKRDAAAVRRRKRTCRTIDSIFVCSAARN